MNMLEVEEPDGSHVIVQFQVDRDVIDILFPTFFFLPILSSSMKLLHISDRKQNFIL